MNLKKRIIVLVGLVATLTLTACTTFKAEGLAFAAFDDVEVLGTFSERETVNEFFGTPGGTNLLNITSEAMNAKITSIIWNEIQKRGGNAARNITITYSAGLPARIVNAFTFGIWAPAALRVEGEVIRTNSPTAQLDTDSAIEVALADISK